MPAKIPKPNIPINTDSNKTGFFHFEKKTSDDVQKHLKDYLLAVTKTGCSSSTIRNYRSDINQFLDFTDSQDLDDLRNKPKLLAFAHYQRDKGLKENSIKRKLVSITQFKIWLKQQGLINSEIPLHSLKSHETGDLKAREIINQGSKKETKKIEILDQKIQKKDKKPQSRVFLLLNLLALFLFLGGLAYFAYQQFGQAIISLAYPSTPTAPNRILSYQGRLTNTAQSPISDPTAMTYTLYDDATGGSILWSSNTCTIDPDQDGIFNANLGAGSGAGADNENCGGNISEDVFTLYNNVWLEVAVGAETLTPRQPIRTVAYALNSATLQGLPPAEIASHSTILMMNSAGEVVLGTDNPIIKAATTSSGLTIEANQITIQTIADSNGNIIVSPDGTGILDIQGNASISGETTLIGNIYISSPNNLIFGNATALGEISSPTDSGAFLIGVYDQFNKSNSTNVQGVLYDLDLAISSAGTSVWSDLTAPSKNLIIAHSTYTTAFNWATGTGTDNLFSLTSDASSDGTGSLLNIQTGASSAISPFRVRAGSTEALFIDNSGNFGVGTITPIFQTELFGAGQLTANLTDAGNRTGILALNGNSTTAGAGGAIVFGNSSSRTANSVGFAAIKGLLTNSTGNTIGDLAFSTRNTTGATALTERMRILASGFVGIGTTEPNEMLMVEGSIVAEKYFDLTNKNYYLDPASVGIGLKLAGSVDIAGNVGVGTSSSDYKLSIGGSTSIITNVSGDITIDPASGNLSLAGNNLINVADGSFTNGYFSNSVGIGVTSTDSKLHIFGGSDNIAGGFRMYGANADGVRLSAYANDNSNFATLYSYDDNDGGSGAYSFLRLGNDTGIGLNIDGVTGKVGIGTDSPAGKLDVFTSADQAIITTKSTYSDSAVHQSFLNTAGTVKGSISGDGSAAVLFNTTSDRRLKENIVNTTRGLDILEKLSVKDFNFIYDSNKRTTQGFIAQDLYDIYPYAVTVGGNDPSKNPWGVDYGRLTPLLVKSIQELNYKINNLYIPDNNIFANFMLDADGYIAITGHNEETYTIATSTNTIDRIVAFADVFTARLQAGLVRTKELIADRINAADATIDNLITTNFVVENVTSESGQIEIVSDVAIHGDLNANSNLNVTHDVQVANNLTVDGETKLSQLIVDNLHVNQATVEGELSAGIVETDELEANSARMNSIEAKLANIENASISGTLYAENIEANSISANIISGLKERLSEQIAESLTQPTLLAALFEQQATQTNEYLSQLGQEINGEATTSATPTLAELDTNTNDSTFIADNAFINEYFEVNGNAYITNSLKIGQSLLVGENTVYGTDYINYQPIDVEDFTFHIQPAGVGRLSLMAGLMQLDHQGFVTINGDLRVAGAIEVEENLKVKGTLLTNMIGTEKPGENIQVQLASIQQGTDSATIAKSNFEFIDETRSPVATVSASGDIALTGSLRINQNSGIVGDSGTLTAGRSAGQAILEAGATEITIISDKVEENSMIYVTPLNSTNNQVLYVKNRITDSSFTPENDGQFTVAIDYALGHNVVFNWWIIQLN